MLGMNQYIQILVNTVQADAITPDQYSVLELRCFDSHINYEESFIDWGCLIHSSAQKWELPKTINTWLWLLVIILVIR